MGFRNAIRELGSEWYQGTKRRLQSRGRPNTRVDSGGNKTDYDFEGQEIDRGVLRDIKEIRESGGVISYLVHAKALMQFGTGVEWQADDVRQEIDGEELTPAEWLEEELNDIDNLLINLGEDAIWYPYAIAEVVETQGGGFSHIEPVEPWTMLPQENEFGEVIAWEQEIKSDFGTEAEVFEPDEIASFILNKSCARDKTGISEVLRAEEEVQQFRENRQAVNQAIEIAGFPHHIWKVGREGAGVIDDNELRRVRNMVDSMEGDTQFVMGRDIDHEMITPGEFNFEAIQEHDLRELALALGLPLELANIGSDGLGSGMPAELRLQLFERQARAAQRSLADQFVQQVARPLLEEYSPFPRDVSLELRFGDPVSDEPDLSDRAPYMTLNEIRKENDLPEEEDEELGESYRKPANIQAPEEEEPEDNGIGGLFSDLAKNTDVELEARELSRKALQEGDVSGEMLDWIEEYLDDGGSIEDTIGDMADWINETNENPSGALTFFYDAVGMYSGSEGIDIDDEDDQPLSDLKDFYESNRDLSSRGMDFRNLTDSSGTPEWDREYLNLFERVWAVDSDKHLFGQNADYETPEFVKERLKDAIWSGSTFSEFADIPSGELMNLRQYLVEQLEDENWNIDGIANRLQDLDADLSFDEAERIARTETASAVNTAREIGYEERGMEDSEFYWVGGLDDRTTEACEWLINETNPNHGGDPVSLEKLKELVEEAPTHDPDMDDNLARPENFVVHPNERKTWVRHVE